MSVYWSRLFPRSNSSFLLTDGMALKSSVLRLRENTFMLDAGLGSPKICTQDELTGKPAKGSNYFEDKAGYVKSVSGEKPIKKHILERIFVDLVAGELLMKERAASRLNEIVGSADVAAGETLVLPRRFRQNRAWAELQKFSRTNAKVKGFVLQRTRGGYRVGIGGFVTLLPFLGRNQRLGSDRFTIESMNPRRKQIVVRAADPLIDDKKRLVQRENNMEY